MRKKRGIFAILTSLLLGAALTCFTIAASANNDASIDGYYMTHDDSAKVHIYQEGSLWQGQAVWNVQHGNVADLNIIVLRNLTYSAKSKNWTGKLYDPFDEREYNVAVKPLGGGKLQVTPSVGIVSRTLIWQKTVGNSAD